MAVWVPNFGMKGEGKGANYGVVIPPPMKVDPADVPGAVPKDSAKTSFYKRPATSQEIPPSANIPDPIKSTKDQVEDWIATHFRPLRNLSQKLPPEIGESVLWRGVKTGKSGGQSTVVEYFNGTVHHIEVENDQCFLYVS